MIKWWKDTTKIFSNLVVMCGASALAGTFVNAFCLICFFFTSFFLWREESHSTKWLFWYLSKKSFIYRTMSLYLYLYCSKLLARVNFYFLVVVCTPLFSRYFLFPKGPPCVTLSKYLLLFASKWKFWFFSFVGPSIFMMSTCFCLLIFFLIGRIYTLSHHLRIPPSSWNRTIKVFLASIEFLLKDTLIQGVSRHLTLQ